MAQILADGTDRVSRRFLFVRANHDSGGHTHFDHRKL